MVDNPFINNYYILSELSNCVKIKILKLKLHTEYFFNFNNLINLEKLELSVNLTKTNIPIKINTKSFNELSKLKILIIENISINDLTFLSESINLEEIILTHDDEINDYTPLIKCKKLKKMRIGNILEINEKISILNLQDNKYMCLFELPILKNINDFRVFINENTKDIPWNTFKSLKILDINCELNLIKANRSNNQKKLKIRLKDEEIVINLLKIYFEKFEKIKSKIKASFSFFFRLITIGNVELLSVQGKVQINDITKKDINKVFSISNRYFVNLDFLKFLIFPLITNLNVENNDIINVDGLIYLKNLR